MAMIRLFIGSLLLLLTGCCSKPIIIEQEKVNIPEIRDTVMLTPVDNDFWIFPDTTKSNWDTTYFDSAGYGGWYGGEKIIDSTGTHIKIKVKLKDQSGKLLAKPVAEVAVKYQPLFKPTVKIEPPKSFWQNLKENISLVVIGMVLGALGTFLIITLLKR